MSEDSYILEAARSIRPYLSELLEDVKAKEIDQQIANLLAQASTGQSVDNLILELLSSQDATREWLSKFLQDKQQPEHERTFSPLPGHTSIVNAAKFVCPQCDYIWYRPRVGIEPPLCPKHNQPLDPA
ncbi:hypothetical protein [Nostoc sp. ChiQUE01b]|uniref:hypothetical protein n=1 Tax=Nostoc sp. ChiQUE01b TaxID=3075376 RepID=UPI002AD5A3D5|nr:hypothetical protein [Nostoc sp. ChiQUE01b]MDZ8259935.1 hypothetical protein [Nostoc sp. ChiQUE01b]